MRSWVLLRLLAVLLLLFAVGHTLGAAAPHARRGAPEAAVFAAMQGFRFSIMGFERSHWDFYRGFSLIVSVALALMAAVAWQLGRLSRLHPRQALPLAITLAGACLGLLVLSALFFFLAPLILSAFATLAALAVVLCLLREGRMQPPTERGEGRHRDNIGRTVTTSPA
jgi:hypothetical protein